MDTILEAPSPLTNEEIDDLRRYLAQFAQPAPIPQTIPLTDRPRLTSVQIREKMAAGACGWCLDNDWLETNEGKRCKVCMGYYRGAHESNTG